MILRIQGEGQYEVSSALLDRLNEIDNQIVKVVAQGDREAFSRLFSSLLELVRSQGRPLPPSELRPSDIILPSPDLTFEEARDLFVGEGLIPE